jgi:hypothetical protein
MSIATPTLWNSAHRPIVYTFSPNYLFGFVNSNSGKAKLAISPTLNLGNFIVGTSCIVTSGIYAGTHKILTIGGGFLTIDTPYISSTAGSVISTRVPVELYAGYDVTHPGYADYPYGLVATITAIRGIDGNCKIDVSGYLKGVLKEIKKPRYGRDFQMSIPFKLKYAGVLTDAAYALNGTFQQADLATYNANGKILNAREPIHFKDGKTIYSMIWNETTEFGEHIVNIVATQGTGNVGGIGFWQIGSTFIVQ